MGSVCVPSSGCKLVSRLVNNKVVTDYFSNNICVSTADGKEHGAIETSSVPGASANVLNKVACDFLQFASENRCAMKLSSYVSRFLVCYRHETYLKLAPSRVAGEDAAMDLTVCLSSGLEVSTVLGSATTMDSSS